MNIKGQGNSLTLVQGHSDSTFSNFFSLETARPIEAKFHVDHPWDGERKFVQTVQVTWPSWPLCRYMVKTLKNLLCWNQKTDDLESWTSASDTRVLPSLLKWCPWVDTDIFYAKFKSRGAVVEWLERLAVVRKVAGSSPARAKRLENSHCPPSSEWVPD